ncbi:MAG: Co2+/Mg2+ efflux protein ApaG [Formosa sp.]|jgi:ApaG protein|nr:Co2+/Mg2+ efflux protein ApaG [Formosa sp.]MDC0382150.1 Co2+/Mg2+ efflux protein ApaG [Flavobacteriaceae bacterium]|tara:strand:+ start:1789 stop:2175 length:387 start_codon:yes stop_codon:yes gene_type:complete
MTELVTKGIKISVKTVFEGTFLKNEFIHYAFSYEIYIKNLSEDATQLLSRKWTILDSLNENETIYGEGVVGKTPIIQPGELHKYKSGCVLRSPNGAMKGFYLMENYSTSSQFKVRIPSFKLSATFAQN